MAATVVGSLRIARGDCSLAVFSFLWPSDHHSGYPTILKHCSLVCLIIPQCSHFSLFLSARDDDGLNFWSDRRLLETSPNPSESLVELNLDASPCCIFPKML
ncbi:hypothetical protein HanIR_Chr09g0398861 [Helianthus annuus]|nr:hypothetical protein HanIR_Chr09g0398861 [Helianthus annuus]